MQYMDDEPITANEIADAWIRTGGDHAECETFRFNLSLHRQVHATTLATSLDLVEFMFDSCTRASG